MTAGSNLLTFSNDSLNKTDSKKFLYRNYFWMGILEGNSLQYASMNVKQS